MCVTHPEQVIERKNAPSKILILKQGSVAFCSKWRDSNYNNTAINTIKVKEGEKPLLLSLEFINPSKVKHYELSSKSYSVLYMMEDETLETIQGKTE